MSETLTIIDADGGELAVTELNNLRFQWPIEGSGERKEEATIEATNRAYPRMYLASAADPLTLTLHFFVRLAGRGLTERIEDLLWTMDPDRGEFSIEQVTSAGNTRRLDLIRESYLIDKDALAENHLWVPVDVTCRAANQLWYDPEPTTVSGEFSGATPVDIAMVNARVPSPLTITVSGDVDTPMFAVGSSYFEWGYTISGDQVAVFVFDGLSPSFGVRIDGGDDDYSGYLTSGSGVLYAPAGNGTLQVSASSGNATVRAQFTKYYKVLF